MTEVLVYSPHSSVRLQYTLYWVLGTRLGLNFRITDAIQEFESETNVKINYSNLYCANCLNIYSNSILYDTNINEHFGEMGEWKGLKTIFRTENKEVPFDIFAAIFYCITRMEEYGVNTLDEHGRYLHTNSVLHKLNVLQIPIVDLWLEEFKNEFQRIFPTIEFKKETFKLVTTFDIDHAFCFKGKGLKRNAGGFFRDIITFNFRQAVKRFMVLSNLASDPYDNTDYILAKQKEYDVETLVFILLADYGLYDKNIEVDNPDFMAQIIKLQSGVTVGIHPSYYSGANLELLKKEIQRLVKIQFQPVSNSRQHYLRFILPETYRNLIKAGIRHEYSLGYPETIGFRAGTAHPFHWYDIENNEVTLLEIHPCFAMDVTFKNYMKLNPEQAIKTLQLLIDAVRKVNGTFIAIWHNESISNYGEWKGWRQVFESMYQTKTI